MAPKMKYRVPISLWLVENSHRTGFVIKVWIHFPSLSERGPLVSGSEKHKNRMRALKKKTDYPIFPDVVSKHNACWTIFFSHLQRERARLINWSMKGDAKNRGKLRKRGPPKFIRLFYHTHIESRKSVESHSDLQLHFTLFDPGFMVHLLK